MRTRFAQRENGVLVSTAAIESKMLSDVFRGDTAICHLSSVICHLSFKGQFSMTNDR